MNASNTWVYTQVLLVVGGNSPSPYRRESASTPSPPSRRSQIDWVCLCGSVLRLFFRGMKNPSFTLLLTSCVDHSKNRPSFRCEWSVFHLDCVVEISLHKSKEVVSANLAKKLCVSEMRYILSSYMVGTACTVQLRMACRDSPAIPILLDEIVMETPS